MTKAIKLKIQSLCNGIEKSCVEKDKEQQNRTPHSKHKKGPEPHNVSA